MMRSLLTERFNLAVHREARNSCPSDVLPKPENWDHSFGRIPQMTAHVPMSCERRSSGPT